MANLLLFTEEASFSNFLYLPCHASSQLLPSPREHLESKWLSSSQYRSPRHSISRRCTILKVCITGRTSTSCSKPQTEINKNNRKKMKEGIRFRFRFRVLVVELVLVFSFNCMLMVFVDALYFRHP